MLNILVLLASVAVSSFAHVFLKKGMIQFNLIDIQTLAFIDKFSLLAFNPWIISGISFHVLALGIWLFALGRVEVSFAYPFLAVGYILVSILSYFWLGESFNAVKLIGIFVIIIGVLILSRAG